SRGAATSSMMVPGLNVLRGSKQMIWDTGQGFLLEGSDMTLTEPRGSVKATQGQASAASHDSAEVTHATSPTRLMFSLAAFRITSSQGAPWGVGCPATQPLARGQLHTVAMSSSCTGA